MAIGLPVLSTVGAYDEKYGEFSYGIDEGCTEKRIDPSI